MSKHSCQTHIVIVRYYRHWQVPYLERDSLTQGVFEKEEDAVSFAEKLVAKRTRDGRKLYEEVIVMRG